MSKNDKAMNMRKIKLTLLLFLIGLIGYGQENFEKYFQQAVDEITDMLQDKKPVSFKRAVFLTENAYYDGKLDWNEFCYQIDTISNIINEVV